MQEIRYLDDLSVGMRFQSGPVTIDEAEGIEFARTFDPQPHHIDVTTAPFSPFNGPSISGWHTAALAMRMLWEMRPFGEYPIIGRGVDELRWHAPVRPGDTLLFHGEIVDVIPSRTKPDRGTIRFRLAATNQHGDEVYSVLCLMALPRRAPAMETATATDR
jgi:acyl dehydratase